MKFSTQIAPLLNFHLLIYTISNLRFQFQWACAVNFEYTESEFFASSLVCADFCLNFHFPYTQAC